MLRIVSGRVYDEAMTTNENLDPTLKIANEALDQLDRAIVMIENGNQTIATLSRSLSAAQRANDSLERANDNLCLSIEIQNAEINRLTAALNNGYVPMKEQ